MVDSTPSEIIDADTARESSIMPALLSDETLAAYLGVSPRLVRQWRTCDLLPKVVALPGRLTRWRRADIDRWLMELPTK